MFFKRLLETMQNVFWNEERGQDTLISKSMKKSMI